MRALALLLAVAAVGCYAPEAPPVPVVFTSLAPDWELLDETHLRCEDQVLAPELDSVSCVWRCAIWQGLPRRVEVRFDVDMHPLEEGTEGPAVGALYFTGASDVDVGDCG